MLIPQILQVETQKQKIQLTANKNIYLKTKSWDLPSTRISQPRAYST